MRIKKDKRRYERYDTEVKIYFYVTYDVRTKVRFKIVARNGKTSSPQYSALSRNVSAEGLCFSSDKKLAPGDYLHLEVLLPGGKKSVPMEGEVRWCLRSPSSKKYDTGVKLGYVSGESVEKSIYHDQAYQVIWSIVLESVLGNFRILEQKRRGIKAKKNR